MEKLSCPICKQKLEYITAPYTTYELEIQEEVVGSYCNHEHYKFYWNDNGTANIQVGTKNMSDLFDGSITNVKNQNRIIQRWIKNERKNWNKNKRP